MRITSIVLVIVSATFASTAIAADIRDFPLDDGVHGITISGDIVPADEDRFRLISLRYDKAIVALDSPGGALVPALAIGRMINLRGYFTMVAKDEKCTSACALIWTAGKKRFLGSTSRLGFHASYLEADGRKLETGVGNALVGRYLTQLGLSEEAVVFATMASPDSVTWLNMRNASAAGIAFELFGGADVAPPPIVARATETRAVRTGWTLVAEGDDIKYYMDINRLGRVGAYRTGWDKADHSQNAEVSYHEELQLTYFDCSSRRTALKRYVEYDQSGKVTGSGEFTAARLKWYSVVPGSVGEAKLDFACGD